MKVNYLALMSTLAKIELPLPEHPGDVCNIPLDNRIEMLDYERHNDISLKCYDTSTLTLVAVEYADGYKYWLEWEFEF